MQSAVFEILTWRSREGVTNQTMVDAMNGFSHDVKQLSGFLQQSLYQKSSGEWVCIYYWETEQQAKQSNTAVANKASFLALMGLIITGSVTMDVMTPLQTCSRD